MEIERLGKYEIRGTLGKGAMGTVYEGWDPIISRKVAIKTVRLPDASDIDAQEELHRFKREAQAAGRLTHPNIVGIFDYGETEQVAYIVMEYVDGRTVKSMLDGGERMPVAVVRRIMTDMLAGLQYSHERGVIHRDIKPANLMITKEGQAKIADFGIARIESSNLTQAGTIMGTPAYMSPEQFMGQTVDATTDIYSAGVLLFQLLTGERPFEGSMATIMHKVLNTVPPKPSELSVTAPVTVDAVVTRAMAKRPEDRFPTAAAFAEALRSALEAPSGPRPPAPAEPDATIIASAAGVSKPAAASAAPANVQAAARPASHDPAKPKSRTPVLVAGAVLAVALGGGGVWFALSGPSTQPKVASAEPGNTAPPTPSAPTPSAPTLSSPTPAAPTPVARVEPPVAPTPPQLASTPTPATAPPRQPNQAPTTQAPTTQAPTTQAQSTPPAPASLPAPQPQVTQVVPPQPTPAPARTNPAVAPTSTQPPRAAVTNTLTQPATIVPPATTPLPAPTVAETPRPATTQPQAVPPPTTRLPAPVVAEAPRPPSPVAPAPAPPTAAIVQPAPALALNTLAPVTPPSPAPVSPPVVAASPAPAPAATPTPTPTVVASAGLTPEAMRRAITGVVSAADCAVVTGDVATPSRVVELHGVIGRGRPEQDLQRAVREVAPTAAVDWGLGVLDGPYCPALNLVRAHVPAFGTGGTAVQIGLKGDQTNLVEGDKVEIRARAPNFPSYLEIDYFSNDGSVAHLIKATAGAPSVQPGGTKEMLAGEVGPPYGTDLIIAIATSAPLFTRDQPLAENAADYLRELRTALDNATRRGAKVGIGVLMVHTSPKS